MFIREIPMTINLNDYINKIKTNINNSFDHAEHKKLTEELMERWPVSRKAAEGQISNVDLRRNPEGWTDGDFARLHKSFFSNNLQKYVDSFDPEQLILLINLEISNSNTPLMQQCLKEVKAYIIDKFSKAGFKFQK